MNAFVHLHLHSEYSIADGIVRLQPLVECAAKRGLPALALTDLSNVHGMVKFHRACMRGGIKPLVGCDVWVQNPLAPDSADRAILLCRDENGYRNLSRLLSAAWLRGAKQNRIVLDWSEFKEWRGGLLALLDDHEGALANLPPDDARAEKILAEYRGLLGDALYLQISRIGRAGEDEYAARAAHSAAAHGIGLAATNRVEFLSAEDFEPHEIRVCIQEGRVLPDARRPRRFTPQQYLRSAKEMAELFADMPEALANTVEIAQRCNLFFELGSHSLPAYPGGGEPDAEILRREAERGLCARLGVENLSDAKSDDDEGYSARLERELRVITDMGFAGYFLIVADFIRWAKTNDIPVGPGRGSGAGSLVAWATGITALDPLRYGLLFERLLNPERVSLPDLDIDFCVEGRDRVIEYVAERYGREQVAQIITFGTMAARAAVRDVGRAMALPLGLVDQVAKMIPFEIGMTLKAALAQENALRERYEKEDEIRDLIDNAKQLEGLTRNVGTHAAGVVIAPRALTEYTPLYADPRQRQATTQLDMDDITAIGLVKFDFLGLRALTNIASAVSIINRERANGKPPLDIERLPLDDEAAFELIRSGSTAAIFQIESRGMTELVMRMQPDKFDDLVALIALFRPGPLQSGMVDDFIARKHGRAEISYPHPDLEPILKPTYGVILYQEQVMQIAQVLAGYTLGRADLLRAAMGKKNEKVMAAQREGFCGGARERGVDAGTAKRIFDLMEKFAGYGFNKSHSTAYAMIAYQTAWLKAHYPAAHMAAALSAVSHSTEQVVPLLHDCEKLKIKVKPPDINACYHEFRPSGARTILYGVGAVKGVGKNVSESVAASRESDGEFKDLFDLCRRMGARVVTKRVLEALVKCGALDNFGDRAALMSDIPAAMRAAEQQQLSRDSGQNDMFGAVEAPREGPAARRARPWSEAQRLEAEKETLGLYLTGHPYRRYRAELSEVVQKNVGELDLSKPRDGMFAGLVMTLRERKTSRGKMGFVTLDNEAERVEICLYSNAYSRHKSSLQKGEVLVAHGEFSADDYTGGVKMQAERVAGIDDFRQACLRRIHIELREERLDRGATARLRDLLAAHRGGQVQVALRYRRAGGESGTINLGRDWRVRPARSCMDALAEIFGNEQIRFEYDVSVFRVPQKPAHPPMRAAGWR
ncbi:MAG: DNA polymerase III subunit alpha [Gammaproteobacteria bacterium]|nr:DNA polymerase III subunit alpha [Gammaproteobacteria bacterium]